MAEGGLSKAITAWKSTDLPALQRFLDNEVSVDIYPEIFRGHGSLFAGGAIMTLLMQLVK